MTGMQGAERGPALPAVIGAALLCLALIAAGGTSRAEAQRSTLQSPAKLVKPGAVDRLRRARCPARYEARAQRESYPNEVVRRAQRWEFEIGGHRLRLKPPIDWRHDPAGSASFRGSLHDLRWLDVLVHAHRRRGAPRPLRRAMRIVVDWVRQNPRGAPTNDRTWFDKVSGDRASMIGYIVRAAACAGVIARRQARLLLGSVVEHGRFLSLPTTHTKTNRGLFVDLGRLLLGRQVRFVRGAAKWRRGGERRFRRTVRELTFPREALWLEHSTDYQYVAINAIARFLDTPGVPPRKLAALLDRMRQTAGLLVMPDRHWLQAGNSYRQRARPWANQARREQAGRMHVMSRSGLAVVNHRQTYLAFLASFHSSIHKHSDDLSFDLYDRGRRIVADTGLYHKDPNRYVDFQDSAAAHSVLTVDGQDFPRDDTAAYGSGLSATGQGQGWFAIEATNPLLTRQGVGHRRLLLYNRGVGVIVADAVRSGGSHVYRRYFQLGSTIRALPQSDGVELRDSDFRGYLYSTTSAPSERVGLVRGQSDPLAGFVFPGFRQREARWTVELATEGANLDNVTTLAIREPFLRAEPIGEIGPTTRLALHRGGELRRILTVRSEGGQVVIDQAEPEGAG
jgi:hypothetical protein